ncbi:YopX family protein [Metasolibacillus sp.]|uniref:YopX family protein n=1 Tax=Metasolibacillus sp. TaxID=2703680 RepID=UPI0025F57540|nr:YopX family protein [Metasolibacillus sp.]MCT6926371.1 YopX family protein [Metasolibacillus sp.]MCT6942597.1 YopX family protein [Metasolibacillus sp.]
MTGNCREIKFRVWDKDVKRMRICGDSPHDSFVFDHETNQICYYNLQNGCGSLPDGTGTYKLMQYTGLKDKYGVEIYEGDIVQFKSIRGIIERYEVEYTNYGEWAIGMHRLSMRFKSCEVIGNVWEDGELLNDPE